MKLLLTAVALLSLVSPAYAQLAVPNEVGLTYGHVHLNVSDVELHKQLWVDHFGGVVTQKGSLIAVRLPGLLVALSGREPTGGSAGSVMDHFGFKVRNMAEFLAKWRAAGYSVGREFTGAEGQLNAFVTMPGGALVELQEDQMLPSEVVGYHVHFRTPDFEELLDWYLDVFDLEMRPRGNILTTTNVPGMNLSFGTADEAAGPHAGAGDRPHRVRGRQPPGIHRAAQGERHRVRHGLPRNRRPPAQHRLPHRPVGSPDRADGGLPQLLSPCPSSPGGS